MPPSDSHKTTARPALPLEDIIEWDIPNWSTALDFWTRQSRIQIGNSTRALEVGSRHGGLSLWAAMRGMKVVCSDLEGPSPSAAEKHRRHGVQRQVEYASVNAVNIPYTAAFDVVLFKSVLGGVGKGNNKANQAAAIREFHKALKPGGELWFAENLVSSPLHRFLRRRFVEWGESWNYVTIGEMIQHLSLFSEVQYTTVGLLGTLGRSKGQRDFLGKLDRAFVDRVVPPSWRYIMVGVARK